MFLDAGRVVALYVERSQADAIFAWRNRRHPAAGSAPVAKQDQEVGNAHEAVQIQVRQAARILARPPYGQQTQEVGDPDDAVPTEVTENDLERRTLQLVGAHVNNDRDAATGVEGAAVVGEPRLSVQVQRHQLGCVAVAVKVGGILWHAVVVAGVQAR